MSAPPAPAWFRRALDVPRTDGFVEVDGTPIHYLEWGDPEAPGLVFIHGGAAHAHWWSFLAPLFAEAHHVVAVDLAGHGESGRRDGYPLEAWARDIIAVVDRVHRGGRPVMIGHSMGGFVTIATAALHPESLTGIAVLDSPVIRQDPEVEAARHTDIFRAPKVYPDAEQMVARFRTIPAQDHYEPYILDHVARHSIMAVEGGYTWRFDPRVFNPWRNLITDLLPLVDCRVALFRAEHGLVTPDIGQFMYEQLGRIAPVVEIPEAGHHMMLDQPLLLLTALRTLLADWEHSTPHRRGG
jgi:pimeloyl-ACP methyl ester carboxylesterase